MKRQSKIMIGILATGLFGALSTGCGTGAYGAAGQWQWTPTARLAAGNAGSSSAVIVAPGKSNAGFLAYGYGNQNAPEYARRDDALSIARVDPSAGLGYPQRERASLNHQRSFYTNRNARNYTYPTVPSHGYSRRRH